MRDLTIEDLDELDALYAKATPAQWAVRPMLADDGLPYDCIISHGAGNVTVASEIDEDTADAQSIAALHNAWPSVSAMLRRSLPAAVPGLAFGDERIDGSHVAFASDGQEYNLCRARSDPRAWFWSTPGVEVRTASTADEAIAAASAHNAARLKGGES